VVILNRHGELMFLLGCVLYFESTCALLSNPASVFYWMYPCKWTYNIHV